MTVCIAIACECGERIPKLIMISDQMFSMGITSSQAGIKIRELAPNWDAMFAGDDVSIAPAVLGRASAKIRESKDYSDSGAAKAMVAAYQEARKGQIQAAYLSSFNWTVDDLLAKGRNALPEGYFVRLLTEIERFDLGCQFLVCGFSVADALLPTMFSVSNPGVFVPQDLTGYAAIGTGAPNAIAYLDRRNQSADLSSAESLYNGLAAKSLAEKALGVGEATTVFLMERGSESKLIEDEKINQIINIWKQEEENIRPKQLRERVSEILAK